MLVRNLFMMFALSAEKQGHIQAGIIKNACGIKHVWSAGKSFMVRENRLPVKNAEKLPTSTNTT
jgi:hypothetical protein